MRTPVPLGGITALLGLLLACVGCTTPPAETPAPSSTMAAVSDLRTVLHRIGVDTPASGKFVVVNIPSFELIALQDGKPALRSRVIVGRSWTPTPELATGMWAVKFNPSWTPTAAMVRREGLRYAPPGPANPLGRILFELDNDQLIFLHDTNDRSLFDRPRRAFSHGCVRVEQARALAAWVLDLSEAEIDFEIARRGTHRLPLPAIVPITIVYRTQFPDESNRLVGFPDVYGRQSAGEAASTASAAGSCA